MAHCIYLIYESVCENTFPVKFVSDNILELCTKKSNFKNWVYNSKKFAIVKKGEKSIINQFDTFMY